MSPNDRVFVTIFLGIFIEALPFLVAGVLISSAIRLFVTPDRVRRLFPHHPAGAAIVGSVLGLVFPMCECGAVPTARSLMQKGAPVPLGVAFILASPVVNPIVIVSTAIAFVGVLGWSFVAWRVGLALAIAVIVALVLSRSSASQILLAAPDHVEGHAHDRDGPRSVLYLLQHAGEELFEMSRYLVIGGLVAAALQSEVSPAVLLTIRHGILLPILAMMLLATVLSICSTVDSFVALSFVGSFSTSALLAFLVFGPMIDLKSTLMLTSAFRRRAVAAIVALTAASVIVATAGLQLKV